MKTFSLFISTPEKTLFEGEVMNVILPGEEGFFEILTHHAPLITKIKAGEIKITDKDQKTLTVFSSGGFFEFYQNKGTLLCFPGQYNKD